MKTNITENEFAVLRAIDSSEYGSTCTDPVWVFSVSEHCGLKPRSVGGVVSSLSKKGLVATGDVGTPDAATAMTKEGAELYAQLCVARGETRQKPMDWNEADAFWDAREAKRNAERVSDEAVNYLALAGCSL